MPQTLFEKLWSLHTVTHICDDEYLLNIDRVFLHERTGCVALKSLEESGRNIKSPANVFCTMDHIVSTKIGRTDKTEMAGGTEFVTETRKLALKTKIHLFDLHHPDQGIVHVVSPELGVALPGITLVCPDSHTCTLGGLSALAWGIGSTDAEHALATRTLRVKKPKSMLITLNGKLNSGVTAKDIILHIIAKLGAAGGLNHAVEFRGDVVSAMSVEGRLTLCNMAVEFSAFTGIIAVDDKTIDYVKGRRFAPKEQHWDAAVAHWQTLESDVDATFDQDVVIDCKKVTPSVTWGTSPQDTVPVTGNVPDPDHADVIAQGRREAMIAAQEYMGLKPNDRIEDIKIDAAFIGSCTNSRLSDLRAVAAYLKGRKVSENVSAICVPGSSSVKRAAEKEGLHQVFKDAGFEWRESGCSMCFYAGGETFGNGKRVISSTNRNFEGRQGPSTRTHLASPLTVAASACGGYIRAPET